MKSNLNLLPMKFQKQLLLRKVLYQWLIIGGAVVLLMFVVSVVKYSKMNDEQNRLNALNEQAEPFRKLATANNQINLKLKTLADKKKIISRIANSNRHLQVLGIISQNAALRGDDLQVVNYTVDEIAGPQNKTPGRRTNKNRKVQATETKRNMRLNLKGIAVDEASIADFMKSLESASVFESVNLKTINKLQISNKNIHSYEIICLF